MKVFVYGIALFSLLTFNVSAMQINYRQAQLGQSNKFVIGLHGKHAGLFAVFFGALNNLAWCERNNKMPVVYWDNKSLYYTPEGYNNSKNVWEYYFEQTSPLSYQRGDTVRKVYLAPDGTGIVLRYDDCMGFNTNSALRRSIYEIIKKYIRIKPSIMKKVESFYQVHMAGKRNIGIHLRGTDKKTEIGAVSVDTILARANELAKNMPGCQFLIATDEVALLEKAQRVLHGKVIAYNATRSQNGKPLHEPVRDRAKMSRPFVSKAQLGEEVLIEVQLLSLCNLFLHTCSNVSSAVLFFNPELENVLFTANSSIKK